MASRRSLSLPIILAIVMILILVVLTVGWVLLTVMGVWKDNEKAGVYIALLSIGTTFIGVLLAGTIIYLVLTIKTINLNRRQSNFIDSVTHELKSPIASMKLYLQTLNRRQVSEEERGHFYRCMVDDLDRLDGLINQLLDAGRLEEGRIDADREDVFLDVCCATRQHRRPALPHRAGGLPVRTPAMYDPGMARRSGHPLPQPDRQCREVCRQRAARGHPPAADRRRPGDRPHQRQRPRHTRPLSPPDLPPFRTPGTGVGTRAARHRAGAVHRPQHRPAAEGPHPRPRQRTGARHGVRSADAPPGGGKEGDSAEE